MSENKIKFPVKLASNNPKSFGIADATEISGHKSVDTLSDLYAISDPVLSILKDGSDAIGQEWFVVSEDCKYRLDNWANRKSVAGWTKLPKQELVNIKQSVSEKDQPNGYAGLDSNGKLPIEKTYGDTATVTKVETYESLPITGLSGVIYYVSNTSAQYKWSGSSYIDITDGADNAKKNETSIFDCSNGTSTKYYSSLSAAINVVPPVYRTSNRIISYLSTENSTTSAVNYQYHGIDSTTWTDLTKWERIPNQADLAEVQFDEQLYAKKITIESGFNFGNLGKGLSAFDNFKLVLYSGVSDRYYLFGMYNWITSSGVPIFKVAKDVDGVRTQVNSNFLMLARLKDGVIFREYLMDGNGYIEFSINFSKFGGLDPESNINYLVEQDNVKAYISPEIEFKQSGWKRIVFESKTSYYIDYNGNWVTGDHAGQKSGYCPIKGNTKRLKITSTFSGGVPSLVFLDKDMEVISTLPIPSGNVMKDYVIDFQEPNLQSTNYMLSRAAFVGVNGSTTDQQMVWEESEENESEELDEIVIPENNWKNNEYYDFNGDYHQGGVSNQSTLELPVKFGDVLVISEQMNEAGAPVAVYFDSENNFIGFEGTALNPKNLYRCWCCIPINAAKIIINCGISNGRCKIFAGDRTSQNLRKMLYNFNSVPLTRTTASWYGTNGDLNIGGYTSQSATKIRVMEGEKVKISTITNGFVPLLVCSNIFGNIIEFKENAKENIERTFVDYEYTIPSNGFYLMVNGTTDKDLVIKSLNVSTIGRYEVEKRFEKLENVSNIPEDIWLKGKRVLWLGTSIPAGGQYPTRSCEALGATCINKAIGASFVRFGEHNPTTPISASDVHRLTGLSQTKAEKTEVWSDWCTADQLAYALTTSWEEMIVPYMRGENKVDLIVIDHGFNDRDELGTIDDITSYNRDTFFGAMAYIIKQIRTIDFRMRIAIATHYDSTMKVFKAADIVAAQELIGKTFGVHVMQSYLLTGLSNEWIPDTSGLYPTYQRYEADPDTGDLTLIQCWMPDGFHVHSDSTGQAQTMFSEVYTQLLKTIR